jgi:hypothetical protein
VVLRTEKLVGIKGEAALAEQIDITKVFVNDAVERVNIAGKNAISSMTSGDEAKMLLLGLKRFTKINPINTKDARRRIAKKLVEADQYAF